MMIDDQGDLVTNGRKIFSKLNQEAELPDNFDQQVGDLETKVKRGEVSQYTVHTLLELYNQAIEYHATRNAKSDADAFNVKIQ